MTATGRYDLAIVSSTPPASPDAPMSGPLRVDGPFGRFADDLLAIELPELPEPSRTDTVAFVCRRATQLPTPLRLGVTTLSIAVGTAQRGVGRSRTTAFLQRTRLPLVGELARMVRSLAFAHVWETWPATRPTGAQP